MGFSLGSWVIAETGHGPQVIGFLLFPWVDFLRGGSFWDLSYPVLLQPKSQASLGQGADPQASWGVTVSWRSNPQAGDWGNHSVVSDSLQPHGLQPTRLLHPWDSPGKNTGVGCHFLLQGIFLTQGSNPGLPHCRQMFYWLSYMGSFSKEANVNGELLALKYYLSHLLHSESEPCQFGNFQYEPL